jgi:hypothetical protein
MTYLSDTLTVGLVLILLFGSIALFLYTRIQQSEQKVSLLESILLDLKMAAEIKSYQEMPLDEVTPIAAAAASSVSVCVEPESACVVEVSSPETSEEYTPFEEKEEAYTPFEESSPETEKTTASTDYESMTVKELQALARMRGLSLSSSLKKSGIVEALKNADAQSEEPVSSSAFMENNAQVSDE